MKQEEKVTLNIDYNHLVNFPFNDQIDIAEKIVDEYNRYVLLSNCGIF
jgi:hypothetical protein